MGCVSDYRGAATIAALLGSLLAATPAVAGPPKADSKPLVVVNGTAITRHDLHSMMLSRGVPPSLRPKIQSVFVERLIDDQLIREFLAGRKVVAPKVLLDRAVGRVLQQFRKQGLKPDEELKKLGLDEASFRRKLALPIAWNRYVREIIGDREIREQFSKRRAEFDGTKLRARQIVLKRPSDDDGRLAALQRLSSLRSDIVSGKTSFEDAAKTHSTAPSGKNGGDVGFFAFRGNMPREIAGVAFSLKGDEISKPFVTKFGVHLLQVTDRKPGQLSLEDARPEIFRQLAQKRWDELVAKLRKGATIERQAAAK